MDARALVLVTVGLALAGAIHLFDVLTGTDSCPLAEARVGSRAWTAQDEPVDFLFAPAAVWRRLALERDLEEVARRDTPNP